MTDKQIIIDGVDVSGCDRLNIFPMQYGEPHEICLTSLEQWGGQEKYCKDRPNCYYKQLKRKEQECERLKKIIDEAKNSKLDLKSFLVGEAIQNEYEQQLDQLKAENEQYKSSKQASYEELQKRWNEVELENRKLKASLDEKNDFLQKLGISATGEFKRIKYYIDKLVKENEDLKILLERLDEPKLEVIDADIALENEKLKQALKNIIDGRLGKCCCPEEYASKVLKR